MGLYSGRKLVLNAIFRQIIIKTRSKWYLTCKLGIHWFEIYLKCIVTLAYEGFRLSYDPRSHFHAMTELKYGTNAIFR